MTSNPLHESRPTPNHIPSPGAIPTPWADRLLPSEGPSRVSEERPAATAFRPLSLPTPPSPGHLPQRGGRRALPVLAPPVEPRRGERAQPGCHGAGLFLAWRGGPALTYRDSPGLGGQRRWREPQGRPAATSGQAPRRRRRDRPACRGRLSPHPLWTGAHVTHCDLQRAAESTPNRKDIVHLAGAAQ